MLELGESAWATIAAREKWNDTGILLVAGNEYELHASGEWYDQKNACGPDGYPSPNLALRLSEWMRREPRERWFTLIGAVEKRGPAFPIGSGRRWQPSASGILHCFANDVSFMYWNNSGEVRLTITRVR
jgi:hypothetical protein